MSRRSLALLVFLTILAAAIGAQCQDQAAASVDSRLIEAVNNVVPFLLQQRGAPPGLNLALARHGKVVWEGGFGYADLDKKAPMAAQTVFHSGSIAKTFTATAVMQLVDQGVIGLYDPINKYFKDFKIENPLGEREITVYDLLTHRSGLHTDTAGSDFIPPEPLEEHLKHDYARSMFETYKGTVWPRWSAKVGEKYEYSNLGMATLAYLVQVTNPEHLTFSEYVQKHIIDPLGMTSTQFPPVQDAAHVRPQIVARFSKGYSDYAGVYIPTPTIYIADYPAGAVVGTPGDLIRLILAYGNGGRYNGYQLLKPETVKMMLSPQAKIGGDSSVGLVWQLHDWGKPDYYYGHGGLHMYGWTNEYRLYPNLDIAIAVATNGWDMINYGVAFLSFIEDYAADWMKAEQAGAHNPERAQHTWAWKVSYVIGMLAVERTRGVLGIESPITSEMSEAMVSGAKPRDPSIWDPAGFRAGVKDMSSVEMTPPAIKAFVSSRQCQVSPEDLQVVYHALDSRGGSLLPWTAMLEVEK